MSLLEDDKFRFVSALVVSAPLSYLLRKLPSERSRMLYSFFMGTLLQYYTYGADIWIPFLVHIFVYLMILVKGRKCGALVTGSSIFALSIYHIYRMWVDYGSWTMDISTVLMTMVCKYSLFAYAYEDGAKPFEKLNAGQKETRVEVLPSFWSYIGYCQFLPTCVIGTVIEYKDFANFMAMQAPFNNISGKNQAKAIFRDFGISVICGGVYVMHVLLFPLGTMQQPSFALSSVLYICFYSYFCVTTLRFKYYFGWKLSQCAVHASGISYRATDDSFKRVQTCNPWVTETSIHLREKVASWNMSCELWLRRSIYERSPFKNKQISQGSVFMISAFWHGFYGGYYISFWFWFLQVTLAANVFKLNLKKPNHPVLRVYRKSKLLGHALVWVLVNWTFTHNGLYFQILDSHLSYQILRRVRFVPPLMLVVGIVLVNRFMAGKAYLVPKDSELAEIADKELQKTDVYKAKII